MLCGYRETTQGQIYVRDGRRSDQQERALVEKVGRGKIKITGSREA